MKAIEILKSASDLVGGDRAKQNGDYTLLHERVAELWSTYLKTEVSADQVVFCMTLLKMARSEFGTKNPDDGIDATAYTAIWAAILEQKNA